MRVYVAGAYSARDKLRSVADEIEEAGHVCTARWLEADHAITPGTINAALDHDDEYCRDHVGKDFEDIDEADVLLLYSASALHALGVHETGSGGRHIETGYAIASGLTIIVVGEPENIFHRGACMSVPDLAEALYVLSSIESGDFSSSIWT